MMGGGMPTVMGGGMPMMGGPGGMMPGMMPGMPMGGKGFGGKVPMPQMGGKGNFAGSMAKTAAAAPPVSQPPGALAKQVEPSFAIFDYRFMDAVKVSIKGAFVACQTIAFVAFVVFHRVAKRRATRDRIQSHFVDQFD